MKNALTWSASRRRFFTTGAGYKALRIPFAMNKNNR